MTHAAPMLAAIAALASGPVLAQRGAMVATTQDAIGKIAPADDRELRQSDAAMRHMVRCVADRLPTKVDYVLSTEPGTPSEDRGLMSLQSRYEWCMPRGGHNGLRFPWVVLRGAFAEELLSRSFPSGVPVHEARVATKIAVSSDKTRAMMVATARCVVAAVPGKVDRLVRTEAFGAAEMRAFTDVMPVASACLDTTYKARLSRQSLRALLADALYSYAEAGRIGDVALAEKK